MAQNKVEKGNMKTKVSFESCWFINKKTKNVIWGVIFGNIEKDCVKITPEEFNKFKAGEVTVEDLILKNDKSA